MRRALKTKVSLLLLAWLVIFAHSIIPHNHSEDSCTRAIGSCHNREAEHNIQTGSNKLLDRPDNEKVCHLSNILFQNFNPENLFPNLPSEIVFLPTGISDKIYISHTDIFISLQEHSSALFRAPPMV